MIVITFTGKRILFGPKHIKMRICVPHQTRELPKLLEARLRALDASDTAQVRTRT